MLSKITLAEDVLSGVAGTDPTDAGDICDLLLPQSFKEFTGLQGLFDF
jgi:hypothetical protein